MSKTTSSDANASGTIQSVSREARKFPPPADFASRALIGDAAAYEKLYRRAIDDPEGFWADTARAELTWSKDFKKVLDWKLPYSKWFEDCLLYTSPSPTRLGMISYAVFCLKKKKPS